MNNIYYNFQMKNETLEKLFTFGLYFMMSLLVGMIFTLFVASEVDYGAIAIALSALTALVAMPYKRYVYTIKESFNLHILTFKISYQYFS